MHRLLRLSLLAFVIFASGAVAPEALAQDGSVTGRVLDAESDLPLPTATVALWSLGADSTLVGGGSANLDGEFSVTAERGQYTLVVSFVGYGDVRQRLTLGAQPVEVGAVRLSPDTEALATVSVQGERTQVASRIDRTVYNTADDPVSSGGSATDVLANLPSVDVDIDGNVSLRGAGSVAVFVNGRPSPVSGDFIASYLRSLPAGTIERVEVIPNPSAAFEPDGVGGIINIVLKENTDLGLGGTLTAGTDTQGGLNATGALTYGKGPWSLAATYGYRGDVRAGTGTSFRINRYELAPSSLDQIEMQERNRTSNFVSFAADYSISRATVLTSQFQLSVQDSDEEELNTTLRADASGAPMLRYERLATELGDGYSGGIRLGLRQTFGERHTLTVEGNAEAEEEGELQTFRNTVLSGVGDDLDAPQQTDENDSERELEFRVDYTRPLAGFQVDFGYNGSIELESSDVDAQKTDDASGQLVPDLDLNNAYDFDERVQAVYAQASRDWGLFGVQLGLRAEQAVTTFDLLTTDQSYDNDYQSLFPSAYLSVKPSEYTTLRGGYSRRINRPRRWELNPFVSPENPDNIRVGNPALKPEYTDSFEIRAEQITGFGSLSITPYYRHTTDVIRRITTVREDGVTVRTTDNLDTADAWGAEGVVSFDGIGGLKGFISLEGYRLQTDGTTTQAALSSDAYGWGTRVNANYSFGDRFGVGALDLQATARYTAPIDTEQGRVGARTFIDLALRQRLLGDKASLTLQARDPLGLAGFSYVQDGVDLYQEVSRDWGAQQVGLTFSYTFGQQEPQRERGQQGGGDYGGGEEY
ncbi:TonB-dependent receptor domain-containing protein [Rubricoccus marinus]|uniref:TonB-dependent receptor n=1 Tax=Rubricoccus marinus TaxID=716817 RepID=A0A259TZU6_9BACT|nr:TonB-dependent receptor [Rubricoccus marinus]OZC03272.1 hypothetical protein BSZ36_09950 [Rubricoccus marinus]